jgi:N-methylhydantoinase B/oxoprolinase/acetone carboxylase alpha subunit
MLFPGEPVVESAEGSFCSESAKDARARGAPPEQVDCPFNVWSSERSIEPEAETDPVTLAVIDGALQSICAEMAHTMVRTAHSPVFFEGNDFTVGLFDANFERIAQREGLPAQMGAMQFGLLGALRQFGWDGVEPGDVILYNNSYTGTPHLPEFCMVRPVFVDGEPFCACVNIAHHTDVGGKAAGSMPGDSTDIHQEGVIIPPVKAFVRDEPDEQIWRIILSNVRGPQAARGDFMAMYGSLATAEERMLELVERYGKDELRGYLSELQNYSERRMRSAIREIPNGTYSAELLADDDGVVPDHPYKLAIDVTVHDEDIVFDFWRSDDMAKGPINCPFGVTLSGAANAIFNIVDHTIPHNQGIFRPIHMMVRPRSLLNCVYPAPLCAGNTEIHNLLAEVTEAALAQALPERTVAPTGATTTLITGGGTHPETQEFFTFIMWEPTGWGGHRQRDGLDAIMTWVGPLAKNFPSEVLETQVPWRVVRHALRSDSGGFGRHRGGVGIVREYETLSDQLTFNATGHYGVFAPAGLAGGGEGALAEYRIGTADGELLAAERHAGVVSPIKFSDVPIGLGERIIVRTPGGGGYGPPGERDPERVLADLRGGYVSEQTAVEVYGLDPDLARETVEKYSWEDRLARAGLR